MIVSKDTNPERDLYYLGAKVIEILASENKKDVDFFTVFEKLNASVRVSVSLFVLTLDWLYLIGAIKESNLGSIRKCF